MSDNLGSVLQRFRAAATNFIEAVDSAPNLERDDFLASMGRCLAELYSSALYLPAVEPDTAGTDETPFPTEKWAGLFHSLKEKIGPPDAYWGVFDSTEKGDPAQGSLAGDISEIYYDLKQDLQLEEKGITGGDLLWELRESFREHWGRHTIEALKAIRDLHL
jgi:Domain of unknown function (DUF5063)